MSTKNKVMLAVMAVVFAVAAVLTIYGIATHSEPGFMTMCQEPDGVLFRYEIEGAYGQGCAQAGFESNAPFLVDAYTNNPHPPDSPEDVANAVVKKVNYRVDFILLETVELEDGACAKKADICLEIGVAHEKGFMDTNGDAQHRRQPDGSIRCFARTSNTGVLPLLHRVAEHELGHCLGLAHDDYELSIMYHTQAWELPKPGERMEIPPWISDDDKELLRDRYLPPSSGDGTGGP